ncbi:Uncharacterised protein [Flavonifractor plautii]|uniref:Uncharacterized protein n=1 Tax=Flavonifractor plautii TaxID=292800 RepID=A0A174CK24_FLAPL|nr:Uncharacterised protein [Flavonifractor plautii]
MARSAAASSAWVSKSSSTMSYSNSFWYCFTRAFFGSVRMRTSCPLSRAFRVVITGRRPTSSGMIPNLSRS